MIDQRLLRRFPTTAYLRESARRRVPHFAFAFCDGGAGSDAGIAANWAALDALRILPRYGRDLVGRGIASPSTDIDLFGSRYAAPFGIAPMGATGYVWPGSDMLLARAAQAARVPFTLSAVGNASIEAIGEIAPDVFWFQLYRFANDDHKIGFDLVARAQAAGARALVLTLDVPVRTTRPREVHAGLGGVFRLTPSMLASMTVRPAWLGALARHGMPSFGALAPYLARGAGANAAILFVGRELQGAFSWDEVKRYRERWNGPLVVKGILHPADAEQALAASVDGVWVSNHGGRQSELLPAAIDCLADVAAVAGDKATVLFDSGIRSGDDILRALGLGARAAFAGKSFLWALAALGEAGPDFLIALYGAELTAAMAQIGLAGLADASTVQFLRHEPPEAAT